MRTSTALTSTPDLDGHRARGILAGLIAPHTSAWFAGACWDRTPCYAPAPSPDRFAGLADIALIDALVAGEPNRLDLADARDDAPRERMIDADGAPAIDPMLARFARGATLVLDHVDRRLAAVGRLCRRLTVETGAMAHANLYVTPPRGQGFRAHYDNADVLILQLHGAKTMHAPRLDHVEGTRQD